MNSTSFCKVGKETKRNIFYIYQKSIRYFHFYFPWNTFAFILHIEKGIKYISNSKNKRNELYASLRGTTRRNLWLFILKWDCDTQY